MLQQVLGLTGCSHGKFKRLGQIHGELQCLYLPRHLGQSGAGCCGQLGISSLTWHDQSRETCPESTATITFCTEAQKYTIEVAQKWKLLCTESV